MTRVPCEHCGQRVGVLVQTMPGDRRRLVRHKTHTPWGRFTRVDWCPGKFERQEQDR